MDKMEEPDETVFYDEPCPRCRSSLRYVKRGEPGKVFCDGCGYVEGEDPAAQCPTDEADALIGTWRLLEFADLGKDGKWQYRFGEHPRGYFVYDATGHVHIQIMKVPPLAPFPEANWDAGKLPSPEHTLAAYDAYLAYFGTYTVDASKHVVTHHVEGSMAPDYTDTDQPRPFKLKGDRLELGNGKTERRVLERVR